MAVSIFDLFKIGIGPSSSHTVGPMKAAGRFLEHLKRLGRFEQTARVRVKLYGSLAHTGRGHGTDRALMLGLQGEQADTIDPDAIDPMLEHIRATRRIRLAGERAVPFSELDDLVFRTGTMEENGAWFTSLRVEYLDDAGEWAEVEELEILPELDTTNLELKKAHYAQYRLGFAPVRTQGVRIIGDAGGGSHWHAPSNNIHYTSITELGAYPPH